MKKIEQLIFCYFNIRNFEILKFRSFYMWPFQMLTLTQHTTAKFVKNYAKTFIIIAIN